MKTKLEKRLKIILPLYYGPYALVRKPRCPQAGDKQSFQWLIVTASVQVYWANEHPSFPQGGKLSQWLAKQPIGAMVEAKGPTGHFHYQGLGK